MTIQDWGVTYDELEPHFDTFEYLCGTSGTAGNLSQAYTNPLGVTLGPCTFCGFCERFGCGNYITRKRARK